MPYLNWKDRATVTQQVAPSESTLRMRLGLDAASVAELRAELVGVLTPAGPDASPYVSRELRLDLPRGWSVFWKLRDGDSRLLVAHPQEEEWVATAALSVGHAAVLLERLGALAAGQEADVGALGAQAGHALGAVSNLELVLVGLAD